MTVEVGAVPSNAANQRRAEKEARTSDLDFAEHLAQVDRLFAHDHAFAMQRQPSVIGTVHSQAHLCQAADIVRAPFGFVGRNGDRWLPRLAAEQAARRLANVIEEHWQACCVAQ